MIFTFAALLAASAPARSDVTTLRAEAYIAAQRALTSEAEDSLAKLAARVASGSGPLAAIERAREQNAELRQKADVRYLALLGTDTAQGRNDREDAAKERDRLEAAIVDADQRIDKLDPAYGELRRPAALDIAKTQALLRPEEGLLLIDPEDDATYIFAITRDRADWARSSALPDGKLATSVASLRKSIVDDLYHGTQTFDRAVAYQLYDELVRPIERNFEGKTELLIVSGGALGTLPLQLLVTDKPADNASDDNAMMKTHWLIDRYALTTLPAVSSLRALRCLLVAAADRSPGCEAVGKGGDVSRATKGSKMVVGFGAPALGPPQTVERGLNRGVPPIGTMFSGALADRAKLLALPSLPGSEAELASVDKMFGTAAEIEIGAQATETRIKQSASLSSARFVIFSTHGLLAQEAHYVGAGEPGLVFTPPPDGMRSELDDGLLTMSEAAQLKLSADLVVLSACNTAGSDGAPGAGGLSGLARSFLFAGAHSLLVSNWVVSDDATMTLMRTVFSSIETQPGGSRAEALRQAVFRVRAMPGFAAPAFWAPFVLVGTGK